jgi:hypothetical protein
MTNKWINHNERIKNNQLREVSLRCWYDVYEENPDYACIVLR